MGFTVIADDISKQALFGTLNIFMREAESSAQLIFSYILLVFVTHYFIVTMYLVTRLTTRSLDHVCRERSIILETTDHILHHEPYTSSPPSITLPNPLLLQLLVLDLIKTARQRTCQIDDNIDFNSEQPITVTLS